MYVLIPLYDYDLCHEQTFSVVKWKLLFPRYLFLWLSVQCVQFRSYRFGILPDLLFGNKIKHSNPGIQIRCTESLVILDS